mmetsp:Transcript_38558/g.69973  ORF Transcript_38558/g.69973 Transcript_38558/m.69973 type:complete len:263 (-) Transcript_38558:1838-2626(-)
MLLLSSLLLGWLRPDSNCWQLSGLVPCRQGARVASRSPIGWASAGDSAVRTLVCSSPLPLPRGAGLLRIWLPMPEPGVLGRGGRAAAESPLLCSSGSLSLLPLVLLLSSPSAAEAMSSGPEAWPGDLAAGCFSEFGGVPPQSVLQDLVLEADRLGAGIRAQLLRLSSELPLSLRLFLLRPITELGLELGPSASKLGARVEAEEPQPLIALSARQGGPPGTFKEVGAQSGLLNTCGRGCLCCGNCCCSRPCESGFISVRGGLP